MGFQIVTDGESRAAFGNPDVVWTAGDLIGAAVIYDQTSAMTLDEVAALSMAGTSGCSEDRNIASTRRSIEGVSIAQTAIECLLDGQQRVIQTTILPRPAGGFYEFGFAYFTENVESATALQNVEGLMDAAFDVVVGGTRPQDRIVDRIN